MRVATFACLLALLLPGLVRAEKIGAVVTIQGNEVMRLSGSGIVIGLNGTGDKSSGTLQRLRDFLHRYQLPLNEKDLAAGNVALVQVAAVIRPSNAVGTMVEARVSAINGAKSLRNGVLLETPLLFGFANAFDPNPVYARALGPLTVHDGNLCNAFLAATESSGALIERTVESSDWNREGIVQLNLVRPSYADAVEIARQINNSNALNPLESVPGARQARAVRRTIARAFADSRVRVEIPGSWRTREPEFMAILRDLEVELETPPVIRYNTAEGRIVISGDVRIARRVVINQRGRTVTLEPPGLNAAAPDAYQKQNVHNLVPVDGPGAVPDLNDLVSTLNNLGLTTPEIIGLFKSFVAQGVIRARLEEE